MNDILNSKVGVVGAITVAGLLVAYLVEKKAEKAVEAVGESINPINPDNVFNRGVNAVGASLTGNENFQLGSWIYTKIHGTAEEQLAAEQLRLKSQVASGYQADIHVPKKAVY